MDLVKNRYFLVEPLKKEDIQCMESNSETNGLSCEDLRPSHGILQDKKLFDYLAVDVFKNSTCE